MKLEYAIKILKVRKAQEIELGNKFALKDEDISNEHFNSVDELQQAIKILKEQQ